MPAITKRGRNNRDVSPALLAQRIAAEHCLLNFPTLYTAGKPERASEPNLWSVPVLVVRPQGVILGAVGELTIDIAAGKIVRASTKESILAAGKALAGVNRNGAKAASRTTARKRG